MHVFIGKGTTEYRLQNIRYRTVDKIHDLHRSVDDAQFFHGQREGGAEKFVVQLNDDTLSALSVVDPGNTHLHGFVKA